MNSGTVAPTAFGGRKPWWREMADNMRMLQLDTGCALVYYDDGGGMTIVIRVDGKKVDIKPGDDVRFEMTVGDRPLRVHVLADRAKIVA